MRKTNQKTAILIILLVILLFAIVFFLWQKLYFTSFIFFAVAAYVFYEIQSNINRILETTAQTLTAIAQEDFSLKVPKKNLPPHIYNSLNNIANLQKERSEKNTSVRILYENIIESIDTGILILKEGTDGTIDIFFSNNGFSQLLEIPKFTKWHLLKPYLSHFESYLKNEEWRDTKDVLTLSINEKEQVFSFRTFLTKVYQHRYLTIYLDTLQSIMDKKEKEAWFNLMKVMSHEILNTITPINSLSDNLEYVIGEHENALGQDFQDIHQSVVTIKNRTRHLADFVNTYRALTDLPSPKKSQVQVKTIIQNALVPLSVLIKEKGIEVKVDISPENLYFVMDAQQIEQVLVNLITNSVYALSEIDNPEIIVRAFSSEKNCIEIIDNGAGIPEEIKREIFIPFFTTRDTGSGIGLSLSKNIVQAHGGYLSFSSKEGRTRFLMQLEK